MEQCPNQRIQHCNASRSLWAIADYCVLLDVPTGGQGRWHSTDKYWLLESFSDSDRSSNQSHGTSTSCGIHVLNGAYLSGSSRTQRVVSLSSCEAELHAMTSTLSDGILIKRCIEFVIVGDKLNLCCTLILPQVVSEPCDRGQAKSNTCLANPMDSGCSTWRRHTTHSSANCVEFFRHRGTSIWISASTSSFA